MSKNKSTTEEEKIEFFRATIWKGLVNLNGVLLTI